MTVLIFSTTNLKAWPVVQAIWAVPSGRTGTPRRSRRLVRGDLAWQAEWFHSYWFLAKFAAVFVLSGVHGHYSKAVRLFATDQNTKSARYWRVMNEVPAVLMIAIVILVVVKPF